METINNELEKMNVEVKITDVLNRFLLKLKDTTQGVTHIYHSVINFNEISFPPLQTDSLPFTIIDPFNKEKPELKKDKTLNWLFAKAFEEIIIALTESLIEAYRYTKLYCLSEATRIQQKSMTKEELENEIVKIRNRALELPFPLLLKEIEVDLNISLPYKSEIISINQVRNCLVHRNGIVSFKDINDKVNNCLQLNYQEFVTLSEINKEIVEVKWEHKLNGFTSTKIGFKIRQKNVEFKMDEKILLDQNIFNNVSFTSILFTQSLFEMLPNNNQENRNI